MRKALSADVNKESIIPLPFPVRPEDLEWPRYQIIIRYALQKYLPMCIGASCVLAAVCTVYIAHMASATVFITALALLIWLILDGWGNVC
jgi:hypothetical protein